MIPTREWWVSENCAVPKLPIQLPSMRFLHDALVVVVFLPKCLT